MEQVSKTIGQLKVYKYDLKDIPMNNGPDDSGGQNNRRNAKADHVGLLAQDVEKIYPGLVQTDPNTGIKSMSYVGLVPILLQALKEQQAEIELLKTQNDAILKRMEKLENR